MWRAGAICETSFVRLEKWSAAVVVVVIFYVLRVGGGEYGGEGVLQIGLGAEIMGQRQQRRWEERGGKGGWGREREGGRKQGREREEERGGRIISGAIGLH